MKASGKTKILVVDDNVDSGRMLQALLGLYHFECSVAAGGAEALSLMKSKDFDVALLDYYMPLMNGDELLLKLQKIKPSIRGIFLTGHPTINVVYPSIQAGGERILSKPVDIKVLLQTISGLDLGE